MQSIQHTVTKTVITKKPQEESISEHIFYFYLQGLKNGKSDDENQCEALIKKIENISHWKQRLDSSHSKEVWLEKFKNIGKKLGLEISDKNIKDVSKAVEKAVRQLDYTWREYWERGRIWA